MGGQILGGGAIALVVAVLWLVYLMPSLQARMRDSAAERNAVRLNQALRVLAETTETPEEMRVELSRREVARQRRLVKRLQAEDDRLQAESDRAQLERKKREVEEERIARAIRIEEERERLAALRSDPRAARARARRRMRLAATAALVAGLTLAGAGAWQMAAAGQWILAAAGLALAVSASAVLQRMAVVGRRARPALAAETPEQPRTASSATAQILDPADRGWIPRPLPAPLTATAGSRAADAVRAARAQEDMRRAVREEPARAEIASEQPAPVDMAAARAQQDAEIERHVRDLLARRAAG